MLVVAVIGLLGYVYYQNFLVKKAVVVKEESASEVAGEGYLALGNWGIKFKIPSNLDKKQITIYDDIQSGQYVLIFSTKRVEAIGGDCSRSDSFWEPSGTLVKKSSFDKEYLEYSKRRGFKGIYITQFDGYNNYYFGPNSTCSEIGKDLQIQDAALIKELLMSLQKGKTEISL